MPDSKLDPIITVDVNAAVKDSKVTAKVEAKPAPVVPVPATHPAPVVQTPVVATPAQPQPMAVVPAAVAPKKKQKLKLPKEKKADKQVKVKVKVKQKDPKAKPKEKRDSYLHLGDYSLHVRPDSAYSHLYRVLAQEIGFESVCKQLEAFDSNDEKACTALLRSIFADRNHVEKTLRVDPQFVAYSKAKTERIKEQVSRGIAEAKRVIKNERRFKNGMWYGNIREMISVCCGSTSPEADNRNVKKYSNAKVAFRQFPRVSRGSGKVILSMYPSKYAPKVNRAIKVVFGDEKKDGFGDYLETKMKQVFG